MPGEMSEIEESEQTQKVPMWAGTSGWGTRLGSRRLDQFGRQ